MWLCPDSIDLMTWALQIPVILTSAFVTRPRLGSLRAVAEADTSSLGPYLRKLEAVPVLHKTDSGVAKE